MTKSHALAFERLYLLTLVERDAAREQVTRTLVERDAAREQVTRARARCDEWDKPWHYARSRVVAKSIRRALDDAT